MRRSTFLRGGVGAAVLAATARPSQSLAQQPPFPSRTLTLVVPVPAGGLQDGLMRALATQLGQVWKSNVIVENRPGGSGLIAGTAVARAPADGYTLMTSDNFSLVTNQLLHKAPPFVLFRDLVPVCAVARGDNVLVVPANSSIRNFKDLVAQAKAKPGNLSYGSFGLGTSPHLDTLALAQATGIDVVHVPYKGGSEIVAALMAGDQLSFSLMGLAPTLGPIRSGRLRPIAFGGAQRSALLPDVPTLGEVVGAELTSQAWFGLFAPAKVPKAVREQIADGVAEVLKSPEFIAQSLAKAGLEPEFRSEAAAERELRANYALVQKRLKAAGMGAS
jgi:tripartite-type tricarboxylate transporter receptor subunit TctC